MTTLHQHATLFLAQIGPTGPTAPPGAAKFNTLAAWVMWGVVLLLVVLAVGVAGQLAWDRSHGGPAGGDGGKVAVAAIVAASAVAIVNVLVLP